MALGTNSTTPEMVGRGTQYSSLRPADVAVKRPTLTPSAKSTHSEPGASSSAVKRSRNPGTSESLTNAPIASPCISPTTVRVASEPLRLPARRMGPFGSSGRASDSSAAKAAGPGVSAASSALVRGGFKFTSTPPQPTLSQPEATVKITAIARDFLRIGPSVQVRLKGLES